MSGFDIVAIGASLGGLSAVETLLEALPAKYHCAIVIAQHRRADSDSRLVELLRSHCVLPVCEPEDKQRLEHGHVYLAPPNYHLLVEHGSLSLSIDAPVCFARPSIDVLFESVADAYGSRAIAVVLTGSNNDGAAGAAAVKRSGGYVLVQDPKSAERADAPLAAIEATIVDEVLALGEISQRLVELCRSGPAPSTRGRARSASA
jgi:two-component system, chemotaxis family, protein-glutamate methylesterase/glutaminase